MVDTAPPIVPLAIERLTTAERVAEALREQLLSGIYRPGTALRDAELSAHAGVSRTTVREALALLAREGLLTHSLHRGMEVTRLSPGDVRDIYATRRLIERAGLETLLAQPGSRDRAARSRPAATWPPPPARETCAGWARRTSPSTPRSRPLSTRAGFLPHTAGQCGSFGWRCRSPIGSLAIRTTNWGSTRGCSNSSAIAGRKRRRRWTNT